MAAQNFAAQNAITAANQTAQVQLQAAALNADTSNLVNQSRYETNAQVREVGAAVSTSSTATQLGIANLGVQTAVQTGVITAGDHCRWCCHSRLDQSDQH